MSPVCDVRPLNCFFFLVFFLLHSGCALDVISSLSCITLFHDDDDDDDDNNDDDNNITMTTITMMTETTLY